jgi:lysophospholipase L1-like esterase
MFPGRLSCLIVATVAFAAACAQTPTGPSAVVPGATVGQTPSTAIPVPPRLGTDPPRALGATRFLAFGDSITWGAYSGFDPRFVFDSSGTGYPERLQVALNSYHVPQVFTVDNQGQPGEQVRYAPERLRMLLLPPNPRPQVVLLLEGINDLSNGVPPQDVVTWLRQTINVALAQNIPVVVATMFQTYEVFDPIKQETRSNGAESVPDYNVRIRQMVASMGPNVHLVDLEPLMLDRRMVGNDGVHNTDLGHETIARAFLQGIERAFPVRGSFQ